MWLALFGGLYVLRLVLAVREIVAPSAKGSFCETVSGQWIAPRMVKEKDYV
jgi:hypothetical protein